MVYLYRWINGRFTLVDRGVASKADVYAAQGYLVYYILS